jgi:microcystin-dependent protein
MEPYLGDVRLFAGIYAPEGWAFCDGSLQQIALNDALYTLLGTTYGGDGVSTFGLPDLRGRVPVHPGTLTPFSYQPGESGGLETVTLGVAQVPMHTHALAATTNPGTSVSPAGNLIATPPDNCKLFRETTGTVPFNPAEINPAGASMPHTNMQPFLALNYIIALAGVYPPRA